MTDFLLGSGTPPTTVTVAYDRMDEAASYDLYVREHDSGTYGTDPLQTRGEYEAALQAQVIAAEAALAAELGGREAVVFLAPMGAHNAIGFEAWQAVAAWAVVTDANGVVQAIRDDTPEGDPEHTQPLADLAARITTAAATDAFAGQRVTSVSGLEQEYRDLGAYDDITRTTARPPPSPRAQPRRPPPAPTHRRPHARRPPRAGHGLREPAGRQGHPARHGHSELGHGHGAQQLDGGDHRRHAHPRHRPQPGQPGSERHHPTPDRPLFALTTLDLSTNSLTGDLPAELGWLDHLTELRLAGNHLTGCVPLSLQAVATHDLASLTLPWCQPPPPANLRAGPPGEGP